MFLLQQPSKEKIEAFLNSQKDSSFCYSEVGASREKIPSHYNIDHNRIQLGDGEETFQKAIKAIQCWQMFQLGWVHLLWPNFPIKEGTTVGILIRHFYFWSLNACRIIYVIEEKGAVHKYGFAYGTLAEHGEKGEERFSVEWNQEDNSVWYDILAFSQPNHFLAKLGYPLTRLLQKRFARDSKQSMFRFVHSNNE